MAANNPRSILERVRNETECCICADTFTDPRVLPCNHTFCLKCLDSDAASLRKRYPGQRVPCPICRQEFTIPPGGLSAVQKNFFMERLVEMTVVGEGGGGGGTAGKPGSGLCDACVDGVDLESNGASVPCAEMVCLDCEQNLCEECSVHHRKNKMTKHHRLDPYGSQGTIVWPERTAQDLCPEHYKEYLLFCENCSEVVCPLCFVEKHHQHKGLSVQKHLGEFSAKMKDHVEILSTFLVENEKRKEKLQKIRDDFIDKGRIAKTQIADKANEIKKLVERQVKDLYLEIDTLGQEDFDLINAQEFYLEEHLLEVESYRDYCNSIIQSVSAKEVVETLRNVNETVNELKEKNQLQISEELTCPHLAFKAVDSLTGAVLGRIESSAQTNVCENHKKEIPVDVSSEACKLPTRDDHCEKREAKDEWVAVGDVFDRFWDPWNTQVSPREAKVEKQKTAADNSTSAVVDSWTADDTSEEGQGESASGGAANSLPWISGVRSDEGEFQTYLTQPTFVRGIRTRLSRQDNHLINGVAVLNGKLYIVHEDSSYIVSYDVNSLAYVEERFVNEMSDPRDIASNKTNSFLYILTEWEDKFYILKVDSCGNVDHRWCIGNSSGTLSVSESGDIIVAFKHKDVLKKYSPDGRLDSELAVSPSEVGTGFLHAVEIQKDMVLACFPEEGRQNGVCLVDMASKCIVETYTGGGVLGARIRSPAFLTVDEDKNILMIDKYGRRVFLCSVSMDVTRELLTRTDHVRYPHKMHLDPTSGRLFLVDYFFNYQTDEFRDSRVLVFEVRRAEQEHYSSDFCSQS